MTPKANQLTGAEFLASRDRALLADLPRLGKTGSAIMAADMVLARRILVITTASGRGVWRKAFADWEAVPRTVRVAMKPAEVGTADVTIVGWGGIARPQMLAALIKDRWDLLIVDEAHAAKSFEAARTQTLYGTPWRDGREGIVDRSDRIWLLTGTPIPNSPADLYPMLCSLWPARLRGLGYGVESYETFVKRYCKTKPVKIGTGYMARWIDVVTGGREENLPELKAQMAGIYLQRTQADVGIMSPVYETMPLIVTDAQRRKADGDLKRAEIMTAAERGDTKTLDMHLGPLRRLTGEIMAEPLASAIKEELDLGLDKIVIAYWHKDVGDTLEKAFSKYSPLRIDGNSPAKGREHAEKHFRMYKYNRVFLAQIQAAGEAIDLSAARQLVFAESTFQPAQMQQMSLRICNHTQKRQPIVRVATLDGSIYDSIQQTLLRKWSAINGVMK